MKDLVALPSAQHRGVPENLPRTQKVSGSTGLLIPHVIPCAIAGEQSLVKHTEMHSENLL